jgi:hypothetical protein
VGKHFGFFQFSNRASTEVALQMLHGAVLGQQPIRLLFVCLILSLRMPFDYVELTVDPRSLK